MISMPLSLIDTHEFDISLIDYRVEELSKLEPGNLVSINGWRTGTIICVVTEPRGEETFVRTTVLYAHNSYVEPGLEVGLTHWDNWRVYQ